MMNQDTLSKEDVELFYRLKNSLYLYANKKIGAIPDSEDWRSIRSHPPEKIMKIRDYVFKNRAIIDEFVEKNPFNLSKDELDIVLSWKRAIVADHCILCKYEPEHALFLHDDVVYGVKGLIDSFRDLFQGYSPAFASLVIIPFKDVFTHEGSIMTDPISIGRTMRNNIVAEAEEIMVKKGIAASLDRQPEKKEPSDIGLIKFYMKSEVNRDRFFDEIGALLKKKSPAVTAVYNYELSRINAKKARSELQRQGIKGYFGVLLSQVIASGRTKKELDNNLRAIIQEDKLDQVYTFSIQ